MAPTTVREFFLSLPEHFDAEAAEGLTVTYQFDLSGPDGGQYHLLIDDGTCIFQEGTHPHPDVVFSMSGEDCLGVLSGRLEGTAVFLSGRIRISGDFGLALQLRSLFPTVH